MADDNQEIDYETATDETSLKIKKLERELRSVSKKEDKKLLIGLTLIVCAVFLFRMYLPLKAQLFLFVLIPLFLLFEIGWTIYQNIQQKKYLLIKHGLQCKQCGFVPSSLNASGVLITQKCLKCRSNLEIK